MPLTGAKYVFASDTWALTFGTAASKTKSVIGEGVSFLAVSVIVITAGLGSFLSNAKITFKPPFSKANSVGMPESVIKSNKSVKSEEKVKFKTKKLQTSNP